MEPAGGQVGSAGQAIRIERMLPLYEAKMIHQYDHRWATYDGSVDGRGQPAARDVTTAEKRDADFVALPRYWVPADEVAQVLGTPPSAEVDVAPNRHLYEAGWRDITNSTNERTAVAASFPLAGVGNNLPIFTTGGSPFLIAALSSMAYDFGARLKIGGSHLNFFLFEQIPIPTPESFASTTPFTAPLSLADWLQPRILELTYTAWDMAPFAEDLDDLDPITGRVNPPFIWDDDRRGLLRAEIDAAFFHLYGISRDDVDYILDTFPIVRKHDEQRFGEYRTKAHILGCYDAMARAIETPYTSPLDPVPGTGPRHKHAASTPLGIR